MAAETSSGAPADGMTKVLVVADCENKEKLLSEVRAYQKVDRSGRDASPGGSAPEGAIWVLTFEASLQPESALNSLKSAA